MLLLTLNRLALRLLPLRIPSAIVTALGWLALMWALARSDESYSLFLRATLTLTLWSLLLFAFLSLFKALPQPPLPALKWHERMLARLRLSLFRIMTFAFIALAFAVLAISIKLMLLR
jgi:hypothetical protein